MARQPTARSLTEEKTRVSKREKNLVRVARVAKGLEISQKRSPLQVRRASGALSRTGFGAGAAPSRGQGQRCSTFRASYIKHRHADRTY